MLGINRGSESYVSVTKDSMRSVWPVTHLRKHPNRIAVVTFNVLNHLVREERVQVYVFDSLAAIGGHFGALRIIFGFFFSMFMPWMGGLEILRNVFLVDPTRGAPIDAADLNSKQPKDLLETARSTQKKRKQFKYSCMERVWLCVEGVFKHLNCRKTKFAKQSIEGFAQVKGELDVYKYLKRARLTDNILKMLTTSK